MNVSNSNIVTASGDSYPQMPAVGSDESRDTSSDKVRRRVGE